MQEEALEESGWKLVHGDVFRPPIYRRLLVALTGAGIQIFLSTFIVIGNFPLLLLSYAKSHVVSQSTAASSASFKRSRPPSNLVNGQELTMCDIVRISPQSHSSLSVKPHFLWHALQWPPSASDF